MRRAILICFGVFLFAGGVGVGVLLQRYGGFQKEAPPRDGPADASTRGPQGGETPMKRKPKKDPSSVESDRRALDGL